MCYITDTVAGDIHFLKERPTMPKFPHSQQDQKTQ